MFKRRLGTLPRLSRKACGASLVELSVSLLLISIVGTGLTGAAAVGVRVADKIETRDAAFTVARSEAEYIASLPAALEYGSYPGLPLGRVVTADVTDGCLGLSYLQCITINVFGDEPGTADATLEIYKATRFLEIDPDVSEPVVPLASGPDKLRTVSVDSIPPKTGFALRLPRVFPSLSSTDIKVRWGLTKNTEEHSRIVAVYSGPELIAGQTGDLLALPPLEATAPLLAIGELRDGPLLSVALRQITTGDYTVYFYNNSGAAIETDVAEISCLCSVE